MSGAKFNPGPWRFSAAGVMSSVGVDGGGTVVCEAPIRYLESRRNWDNNAPLIAAAPDLYEALKFCAQNDGGECLGDHPTMLAAALSAIAKAEGRA